jgi:hypothetical protein
MIKSRLFHTVFFELKDSSESSISAFVEDSYSFLQDEPGIITIQVGRLVDEHAREVNDLDFHVSLHILFESKQHHDDYQISDRHNAFVSKYEKGWKKVRVFDSYVQ